MAQIPGHGSFDDKTLATTSIGMAYQLALAANRYDLRQSYLSGGSRHPRGLV